MKIISLAGWITVKSLDPENLHRDCYRKNSITVISLSKLNITSSVGNTFGDSPVEFEFYQFLDIQVEEQLSVRPFVAILERTFL